MPLQERKRPQDYYGRNEEKASKNKTNKKTQRKSAHGSTSPAQADKFAKRWTTATLQT